MPQASSGGSLVTGANIVDDTISNDDVSSTANIAKSKLNLTDGIDDAELKDTLIKYTSVNVSSAEILALHTTPKTLIAAPGTGKQIIIEQMLFDFTVGTQYANGDLLVTRYAGDSNNICSTVSNSIINAAASSKSLRLQGTSNTGNDVIATAGADAAVELTLNSATAFITGTGTLKIHIWFRIITL